MIGNRKLAKETVALTRSLESLNSTLVSQQRTPSQSGRADTGWDLWSRRSGPVVTVVTALAAVVSVFLLNSELKAISHQSASAEAALRAETRTLDSEFLSGLTSSVTATGISITNRNRTPITPFSYWLLQADNDETVQEIEGAVQGLAPCSTMSISWSRLADVRGLDEPTAPSSYSRLRLPFGQASELHLAAQAPSGEWFLAGSSGSLWSVDLAKAPVKPEEERLPQDRDPSNKAPHLGADLGEDGALKALHAADLYRSAADTYLEGYETHQNYAVSHSIGMPGNTVTGASGEGVRTERVACSG